MKKIISAIIALFLMTQICSAKVVLHRYYDTLTNEEMGTCYSSKDGVPAHNNPDWTTEIINESQKQFYIDLHRKQLKAKAKTAKDTLKAKRKDIKDKLKVLGFTNDEVDLWIGESL